jgi:hypothetical protein
MSRLARCRKPIFKAQESIIVENQLNLLKNARDKKLCRC